MSDTYIVGGRGTMDDSSNENGGGFVQGGSATYLTCQGTNGGYVSTNCWSGTQIACDVTDAGSDYLRITGSNSFTNCSTDMIAYINFLGTYQDDWYVIIKEDDSNIKVYHPWYGLDTCDIKVGGALRNQGDGLSQALSLVTSGDSIHITTDTTTSAVYAVTSTISPPATASGTGLSPIVIKGANGDDGTDLSLTDARPIFKASTTLASGIININNAATDYYRWENIIFDGDNDAAYCVYSNVSADWHYWSNCLFKNSTTHGVSFLGNYWRFVDCIGRDSGVAGIVSDGENCLIINSESYDNTYNGFVLRGKNNGAVNCKAYNNQSRGFIIYENNGGFLINCTCYNSGEENYNFSGSGGSESTFVIVCNCTGDSAGIGFDDYEIDSVTSRMAYFGNNHANSTSYCSECINDNFTDYLNGNNITGDPKFVSVVSGSEDFDLLFDSPLQRTGINNTTIGAGTRLELTEGRQDVAFNAIYIQEEDVS